MIFIFFFILEEFVPTTNLLPVIGQVQVLLSKIQNT